MTPSSQGNEANLDGAIPTELGSTTEPEGWAKGARKSAAPTQVRGLVIPSDDERETNEKKRRESRLLTAGGPGAGQAENTQTTQGHTHTANLCRYPSIPAMPDGIFMLCNPDQHSTALSLGGEGILRSHRDRVEVEERVKATGPYTKTVQNKRAAGWGPVPRSWVRYTDRRACEGAGCSAGGHIHLPAFLSDHPIHPAVPSWDEVDVRRKRHGPITRFPSSLFAASSNGTL